MVTLVVPPASSQAEAGLAVVGMAGRFPSAPDITAFWEVLKVTPGYWLAHGFAHTEFIEVDAHRPQIPV